MVEGNTIASSGSAIAVSNATGNTIGGTVSGAGNTLTGITGNVSGVFVNSGSNGTLVAGNSISGCSIGIYVQESSNVTIGGTTAAAGNVLSGGTGIALEDDSQTNLTDDELIEGNEIGTTGAGTAVGSGVSTYGIFIGDSSFDTIGGTATGSGNLISGNQTAGIDLSDLTGITSGDLIQGNRIGTDATGTNKLGNGVGIIVNGVSKTIGGTAASSGNVISGNLGDRIFANNSAQPALAISPLPADIGVISGVPKGPAKVGQGVPYTFIVANFGPGTATDVQLAILGQHPSAASIVKVETSQGNITTISSSAYIVNVGTLLADEMATVTVIVKPLKTGGNATVYAFAGWPGPDPNLSDNPTFANIPIGAPPKVPVKTNPKTTANAKTVQKSSVPSPTLGALTLRASTLARVAQQETSSKSLGNRQ